MKVDIKPLLMACDLDLNQQNNSHLFIDIIPGITEEYQEKPEDNWLFYVFKAFILLSKKLELEGKIVKHFISVGTGIGVDVIGGYLIFKSEYLTLTDINSKALEIANNNITCTLSNFKITVKSHLGYLLENLDLAKFENIDYQIMPDIIYANLPTLFSNQSDNNTELSAAFFNPINSNCPRELKKYQLELNYEFCNTPLN
jgi:hypothetical protein